MKKLINKEKLGSIFLVFMCLSCLFDLHIFYNRFATLIRLFFILVFFGLSFIKFSSKKDRFKLVVYLLFVLLYSILHLVFVDNYLMEELLYIFKMTSNVLLFYSVYSMNIDYKKSIKFIKIILWFICGSIVLCNFFKLGYSSYSFNYLKYNIFDWFKNINGYFEDFSGKGFFHLANQIVGVVLLFYPMLINEVKENKKVMDIVLLNVCSLSMLMIGNRTSSAGPLIILIFSFVIYLFLVTIKKEKLSVKYILILVFSMIFINIFLYNAPIVKRDKYYNDLDKSVINITGDVDKSEVINKYISNNKDNTVNKSTRDILLDKNLNINFIDNYYLYDQDQEFWDNLVNSNIDFKDSRLIELKIAQRLVELSDNKLYKFVGIGYYKIISVCNIERDYVMQYYSVGILGLVIFIGFYFIIYIKMLFKVFINLDKKFNYLNIMLLSGIGINLIVAYLSGNILNALSSTIPLTICLGIAYNEIRVNKPGKVLNYNICKLNKKEIINELNNSDNRNILFNINPIIMVNFNDNKEYKKFINKEKYNIPDGFGTIVGLRFKDNKGYSQITGVDMFNSLVYNACKYDKKVYLYGAKKEVIEKTVKVLKEKYINLNICGYMSGYSKEKDVLNDIKKCKPDYLFVGIGSPKQEEFIIRNEKFFRNIGVIMPVGGTFDVVSGLKKRAPIIYQKLHLEWLYRMIKEPKRIKDNVKILKYLYLVIFKNGGKDEK